MQALDRHRRSALLLILLAGVALGAGREFLFLNLNYQIHHVRMGTPYSYAHSLFQGWVAEWGPGSLVRLKWSLSIGFAAIMLALCITLARVLFGDHKYRTTLLIGYLVLGVLAVLLNWAGPQVPALAAIAVKLLHALQYPVMLFLVWAAWSVGQRGKGGATPTA